MPIFSVSSTELSAIFGKTLGFIRLAALHIHDYEFRCPVLITRLVWPALVPRLATLFSRRAKVHDGAPAGGDCPA
jgi:hypothetical protein